MNKKQIIGIFLILVLCFGLVSVPAYADESKAGTAAYPFVFVHGLLGYGDSMGINEFLPYWGMTTGSLTEYLSGRGFECYAANVGPLSSAWDRACELYAQLTGTTVDFGVQHSAEKDHERFGTTYSEPLFDGWSAEKKINLIGHSFGGATIRLFFDILENGRPEEVAAAEAAGLEVSPFFEGGKGDWVYSLTAMSAPHNGTSFFEACSNSSSYVPDFVYAFGSVLSNTSFKGLYDLNLGQFGIYREEGESDAEFLIRAVNDTDFLSHNDNAMYDLRIDNALKINDDIGISDKIYYFSITGDTTYEAANGNRIHKDTTMALENSFADYMGRYYDKYTEGGYYIDRSWLPNDGLVNVVSALYPTNSRGECLKSDGNLGYTYVDMKEGDYERGVWNVLPVQPYDHFSMVGGLFSMSVEDLHNMYNDLIDTIVSTYPELSGEPAPGFTIINRFFDHSNWMQVFGFVQRLITWFRSAIGI